MPVSLRAGFFRGRRTVRSAKGRLMQPIRASLIWAWTKLQTHRTHIDIHGAVYRVGHVFRCTLPRRLRVARATGLGHPPLHVQLVYNPGQSQPLARCLSMLPPSGPPD